MRKTVDELAGAAGAWIGPSAWVDVSQDRITMFGRATNDLQWIHIDPSRAAHSPFGSTIAHGFFTLSLLSSWVFELLDVADATSVINYGVNRARFPAPVPVGSRVRGRGELVEVTPGEGWVQVVIRLSVEIEESERPACVADFVVRYIAAGEAA